MKKKKCYMINSLRKIYTEEFLNILLAIRGRCENKSGSKRLQRSLGAVYNNNTSNMTQRLTQTLFVCDLSKFHCHFLLLNHASSEIFSFRAFSISSHLLVFISFKLNTSQLITHYAHYLCSQRLGKLIIQCK